MLIMDCPITIMLRGPVKPLKLLAVVLRKSGTGMPKMYIISDTAQAIVPTFTALDRSKDSFS